MSTRLQFSDPTHRNGIVELLGELTGTQGATNSSYSLDMKTRDINSALLRFMFLANLGQGKWQADDTNQVDFPVIYGDIVQNQQDYSFVTDETGNQILDIYKVRIQDSTGKWITLKQRDLNRQADSFNTLGTVQFEDLQDEWLNTTVTGVPAEYDITGNSIVFDVLPNYSLDDGIEIYISRTPTYFLSTDTTKKPGIPDYFHEYLALRPAYFYCVEKGLPQANSYEERLFGRALRIGRDDSGMEKAIQKYYANRNREDRMSLSPPVSNNHI